MYIAWFAVVALLCGSTLRAQDLPALGKASEIVTGCLPDGISYYLINNPHTPGFADFALVQPSRNDRKGPREDLVYLKHFYGRKPYEFLADNAVGYSRRGFIEHTRNSTVFRFSDVPVSRSSVTDSSLLMLFDLARSSEYEQAIVVSGDIDLSAILERIRIMSMTISRRSDPNDAWSYGWRQQDEASVTTSTAPVGSFSVVYRSPRTDSELMNTIQPVMSRLLANELDVILKRRIRTAFTSAGIPLADYLFRYTGSDETSGDELVTISIHTSAESLEPAIQTVAGILASLDEDGATVEEVTFARTVIAEKVSRDYSNYLTSNSEYLDKCISSYLYGSNLASTNTLSKVYTGRKLDPGRECELLNRYIAALLSPRRNLHLRASAPVKPEGKRVKELFALGWSEGSGVQYELPSAEDTLKLALPRRNKIKLKSTARDSFTGGKLWTFSNGMSVVYKKTADKETFHYGLMMKGGWSEIIGIHGAEPAFAQEVLALGKVAGMNSARLRDLLAMYGVSFEPRMTMTDVRFVGSAPSSSLSLVLKTMVSAVNNYENDSEAYARYLQEKPIRLVRDKFSDSGTKAVLDSTMSPGYVFAAGCLPALPDEDLDLRMRQYMVQRASNMMNGVIVLVGDLDETVTLKLLSQSLGSFKTGQQRAVRPKIPYKLRECWSTNFVQRNWRSTSVSVAMSALWPFGAEGYSQMRLACTVLKAELDKALMKDGMYCTVSGSSELLPAEKMTIYVHCEPLAPQGLPADVTPALPVKALDTVRSVLNRLAVSEISDEQLKLCKTMLTNRYKADEGNTELLRDAVLDRGSVGQDVRASYAQRISSVTAADVQKLFAKLSGSTAEFIVQ